MRDRNDDACDGETLKAIETHRSGHHVKNGEEDERVKKKGSGEQKKQKNKFSNKKEMG